MLITAIQAREVGILVQHLTLIGEVLVNLLRIADHSLLIRILGQIFQVLLLLLGKDVLHGVSRVLVRALAGELRVTVVGALARQGLLAVVRIVALRGAHVRQSGVAAAVHLELEAVLGEMALGFVRVAD